MYKRSKSHERPAISRPRYREAVLDYLLGLVAREAESDDFFFAAGRRPRR